MKDISELEKSACCFRVKVSGEKPLTVKWSDEDGPINPDDVRICCEEDEEEDGVYTLSITEIDYECDSGVYRCEATNKHGTTISEATLFVEEMPGEAKHLVDKVEHKE